MRAARQLHALQGHRRRHTLWSRARHRRLLQERGDARAELTHHQTRDGLEPETARPSFASGQQTVMASLALLGTAWSDRGSWHRGSDPTERFAVAAPIGEQG